VKEHASFPPCQVFHLNPWTLDPLNPLFLWGLFNRFSDKKRGYRIFPVSPFDQPFSLAENLIYFLLVRIHHVGNPGDVSSLPGQSTEVVPRDIFQGKLPGSGHELLKTRIEPIKIVVAFLSAHPLIFSVRRMASAISRMVFRLSMLAFRILLKASSSPKP